MAVSLTVTLMDFYLKALEVSLFGAFNFLFSASFVSSPNPRAACHSGLLIAEIKAFSCVICSLLLWQAKTLLWGSSVLFGPSMFMYNWSNLSDSGALWPGMKPESGLIQTPSTSQHSVLTCTTGLTTSQPSPAHYSYSIEGNLAWFLSASLST